MKRIRIRPAKLEEAEALTALMRRSKAHWGYDPAFMSAAQATLTVDASDIALGRVWVAEAKSGVVGVVSLAPAVEAFSLEALFVDPHAIGTGAGEALFTHAAETARALGGRRLVIEADPNAAGFYERMGARKVGEAPGAVPGRSLPVYELAL